MASDAEIESIASEEFSYKDGSISSSSSHILKFLVFDFNIDCESITPGKIISRRTGNRYQEHEHVQRDLILSLKSSCNVIGKDEFSDIFGSEHEQFLLGIHSVVIVLPITNKKSDFITFFISKEFSNTPSPVCQHNTICDSAVPFYCRMFPKPVHLNNIEFMKRQLSNEIIHLCHKKEAGETAEKINYYNMANSSAYCLSVVKYKTNILKFVYHQSYDTSVTHHVEYQSTDTLYQCFLNYLKKVGKFIPEFSDRDIHDYSMTDDYGKRIDNYDAIISLLVREKELISDSNLFHSYPTFLVHLTPKQFDFGMLRVRILGDDRGHMHPFSVFIRKNCSTFDMRQEIAKHCHWKPRSFEVFPPNSSCKLKDVTNVQELQLQFNSASVFTVRKISKICIFLKSALETLNNVVIEEYPSSSILKVKNKIASKYRIVTNHFDLINKGVTLQDHITLEEITDGKVTFDLAYDANRLVFRLYIHKRVANRDALLYHGKFLLVKIDDPNEPLGEFVRLLSERLDIHEEEFIMVKHGHNLCAKKSYFENCITYQSLVCLIYCPSPSQEGANTNSSTTYWAKGDGFIEKGNTPTVAALQIQLRRLQTKDKRTQTTATILNLDNKMAPSVVLHRMESVPNNHFVPLVTVNRHTDGYKSDTDLVTKQDRIALQHSPSDSRLYADSPSQLVATHQSPGRQALSPLNINAANQSRETHYIVQTPPSRDTPGSNYQPGSQGRPGYQLFVWGDGYGNIPDLKSIIGTGVRRVSDGSEQNQDSNWNRLFLRIAREITLQWENVGRYLNLAESSINIIDQNNGQIEQKSYLMLVKWREINGQNATKELLMQALIDVELRIVAEIVNDFDLAEIA